jgi:SAM-dependent methyltransferase
MHQLLSDLIDLQQKPAPFTPGDALFWDDPHISAQLLKVHLDPNTEAASRPPATIERSVRWLIDTLALKPGEALLDLGCGPGLYARHLANAGLRVTGVDYSQRSIEYARQAARDHALPIEYRYQNYLELADENCYEAACLIYGDFCPLAPQQRARLLRNIQRALKPGGKFVLDVSTREHRKRHGAKHAWYAADGGFWKPGPHLVLEDGLDYPEQSIWLDQYIVITADGTMSVYRNWFQDYTPDTITAELLQGGFVVESLWGDLTGSPYTADGEWIGLVAARK